MRAPRRTRRSAEPETAADLVAAVVARLGGEPRLREQRAFEAYELAVGEMLRGRTQPEQLRGKTLFVRTASSALAHHLTLLRAEILERMAVALGPDLVTDLRTRIGPLRAPGPG